jgi:hypothetical protein
MIELVNIEQQVRLQIAVTGYESPNNSTEDWLVVSVVVDHHGRRFERLDSALEARDLEHIETWFTCLSERRLPRWAHLTFIEPGLEFEFLAYHEPTVRIAINLRQELQPHFMLTQFKSRHRHWSIVCELTKSDFVRVITGVQRTRERYPPRAPIDRSPTRIIIS